VAEVEPVADVEPSHARLTASEPVMEPVMEPVIEPAVEPVAEPAVEPVQAREPAQVEEPVVTPTAEIEPVAPQSPGLFDALPAPSVPAPIADPAEAAAEGEEQKHSA